MTENQNTENVTDENTEVENTEPTVSLIVASLDDERITEDAADALKMLNKWRARLAGFRLRGGNAETIATAKAKEDGAFEAFEAKAAEIQAKADAAIAKAKADALAPFMVEAEKIAAENVPDPEGEKDAEKRVKVLSGILKDASPLDFTGLLVDVPGKAVDGDKEVGIGTKARAWAKANGVEVSERGVVSADVIDQYKKATASA